MTKKEQNKTKDLLITRRENHINIRIEKIEA